MLPDLSSLQALLQPLLPRADGRAAAGGDARAGGGTGAEGRLCAVLTQTQLVLERPAAEASLVDPGTVSSS